MKNRIYPYIACPREGYSLDPLESCHECCGLGLHLSISNPAWDSPFELSSGWLWALSQTKKLRPGKKERELRDRHELWKVNVSLLAEAAIKYRGPADSDEERRRDGRKLDYFIARHKELMR